MVPLVPTYIWPTNDAAFQRALSGYAPGLAIVTGDNSGPGADRSSDLQHRIEWLGDRGWRSVGYVRLDYMKRSLLDIAADVTRWRDWYPSVSGIFFDECPTLKLGALEAAAALESLVCSAGTVCVFNPGAPVDASWFSVLSRSTIVTFEGSAEMYANVSAQRHARAAHLVYGATAPVGITAGFGSSTTDGEAGDTPMNPWDADGVAAQGVTPDADRIFDIRDTAPAAAGTGGTGRGTVPA